MASWRLSVVARLAGAYGLLILTVVPVLALVVYQGTLGVLSRTTDEKILGLFSRLSEIHGRGGPRALPRAIGEQLGDGTDTDDEIILVLDAEGRVLAGNLIAWPDGIDAEGGLQTVTIERRGRAIRARVLPTEHADGIRMLVGHDLRQQAEIRSLVLRSLGWGMAGSLLLGVLSSLWLRRWVDKRVGEFRRTAGKVEGGDLTQRIAGTDDDEFGRLAQDINRMLERIESLVDGVRHVSDAIAHDLRTPLTRVRSELEGAAGHESSPAETRIAIARALEGIDNTLEIFNRLLQLAEWEAGVQLRHTETVLLHDVLADMVDLYDAIAEERDIRMRARVQGPLVIPGDRQLIATAIASLLDNALKYSAAPSTVEITLLKSAGEVRLTVRDEGPGIPEQDLPRVTERFFRVDTSRHLPGNGLGLAIVDAIARLHGGRLELSNTVPGLAASLVFPLAG